MVTTNTAIPGKSSATQAHERHAVSQVEGAAPLVFKGAGFDLCRLLRAGQSEFLAPVSKYPALLLREPERLFGWDEFDGNVADERF
jgi:hypothetical protein